MFERDILKPKQVDLIFVPKPKQVDLIFVAKPRQVDFVLYQLVPAFTRGCNFSTI